MQQPIKRQAQKHVVVIGSGIIGVCSAYFLTEAGHQVTIVEQRGHVAELSTLGNSCIVSAGAALPWAKLNIRKQILTSLFRQTNSTLLHPRLSPALWRWIRSWVAESNIQQFYQRTQKMQVLADYSQSLLKQIQAYFHLDFEQRVGLLRLFRSETELAELARIWINIPAVSVLDAGAVRNLEPALAGTDKLAGGLYFADIGSGNCALFTKQLKIILQEHGVPFYFDSKVTAIIPKTTHVHLHIDGKVRTADAVVCAAGYGNVELLKPLGLALPLYAIKTYTATAPIKNYETASNIALLDDQHQITIARIGSRMRLAGIAEFGAPDLSLNDKALCALFKVAQDWFPNAANFNRANFWCGHIPMLADEVPLIGQIGNSNVFVNITHGGSGWSMALGAAKLLADQISGYHQEINIHGLSPARYC